MRHGQTHANVSGELDTAHPGLDLTDLGRAQAAAAAKAIAGERLDAIYVSSRVRTHQTAAPTAEDRDIVLPSRNHAIVLVSKMHLPTLRALAYARATRPDVLEAITVSVDDGETRELVHKWEDSDITVPLKVIASPYREITRPVLEYVRRVSKESPRTVVTVFIPEYVVGHWWEQVLHNQSALRLKGRLLFMPNVMVTSVPWQLSSSERLKTLQPHAAPGDIRRGFLD